MGQGDHRPSYGRIRVSHYHSRIHTALVHYEINSPSVGRASFALRKNGARLFSGTVFIFAGFSVQNRTNDEALKP